MRYETIAFNITATIVPFPLFARTAEVRRAASLLTIGHLSDEAATNRWVRITDRLAHDLQACGVDPIVIAMQLCDFEDAVNEEIARRARPCSRH